MTDKTEKREEADASEKIMRSNFSDDIQSAYGRQTYISVIIPAYNCEKTLAEAVHSVLEQTYPYFELIIVNDSSQDGTKKIAEELEKKDSRVRVLENTKNSGVAASRNRGVAASQYGWIAFLDSDDVWKKTKLRRQLERIATDHADIVFTGYGFINEGGTVMRRQFHVPPEVTYPELLKQNVISCSGILLRKGLLENCKMEHDSVHEDYLTWLRLLKAGAKAVGIDEPLHWVRIFQEKSKSANKLKSAVMNYRTYRESGLNIPCACYYMIHYTYRGLKKYGKIRAENRKKQR